MLRIPLETVAILAPGESMTEALALAVAETYPCIAVTETYKLIPTPLAIVAQDSRWWQARPHALASPCDKWSSNYLHGISRIRPNAYVYSGTNSGLAALYVAVTEYRAKRILLFGFDMSGSHFFGRYEAPLQNADAARYERFRGQFETYASAVKDRCEILNCTPGSALDCFPLREDISAFIPAYAAA